MEIRLKILDDNGDELDSTPADVSAEAVEDIVDQAVLVVRLVEQYANRTTLDSAVAELREALESYGLIEPLE